MEEVKYFTPSIEDIRVGYEYELFVDNEWKPFIMSLKHFTFLEGDLKKGYRVPYLTKEQIEAEGYRFEKDNYGMLEFSKWETEIRYWPDRKKLHVFETGQKPPHELFYGECKDINTFRYICKLLGI